jgi:hypothetical protein
MSEATVAAKTVGQDLDAELAVVKARIAVLEADAKTDWSAVKAWVSANWPHFVTWASAALVVTKTDALSVVTKLL